MLYLVATPIGNLSDISFRAIEVLQACDYILCEDTRRSRILLQHYKISKPLKSYHQWNEMKMVERVIADLDLGKNIALISDAGTPGISDPGNRLVIACRKKEKPVVSIPGACAAIVALSAAGLPTSRFQFIGFLPRKKGKLQKLLEDILQYPGATVCYESPHRLLATITALAALAPDRWIVISRELTKKFEEYLAGTAEQLREQIITNPVKGEFVIMVGESN